MRGSVDFRHLQCYLVTNNTLDLYSTDSISKWMEPPISSFKTPPPAFCLLRMYTILVRYCAGRTPKLTSHSLSGIINDVVTKLPREIRDTIYQYVLAEGGLEEICRHSTLRLDSFPSEHDTNAADPAVDVHRLSSPASVDGISVQFTKELIEMLYGTHSGLCVVGNHSIPEFLDTDFFRLGLTPKTAKLSKLRIHGSLDVHKSFRPHYVDLNTLESDLDALMNCKWGANFDLEIAFGSGVGTIYLGMTDDIRLSQTIHSFWNILKPSITKLEARGARVSVTLMVCDTKFEYRKDKQSMLDTEEEWLVHVKQAFEGNYRTYVRPRRRGCGPEVTWGCMTGMVCLTCCCGCLVFIPAKWCWDKYKKRRARKWQGS